VKLFLKRTNGLEREREIFTIPHSGMDDILPNSWSLDDQQILCTRQTVSGGQSGITAGCRRRADPVLEQRGQRDERADFS
jgi:hypothetical protein